MRCRRPRLTRFVTELDPRPAAVSCARVTTPCWRRATPAMRESTEGGVSTGLEYFEVSRATPSSWPEPRYMSPPKCAFPVKQHAPDRTSCTANAPDPAPDHENATRLGRRTGLRN